MVESVRQQLFSMQDPAYKVFQSPLIPNLDPLLMIGVRTPRLRTLAKQLHKQGKDQCFLSALPHKYFEENNLHAFLIGLIPDVSACIAQVNQFLPYVDNWATCDSLRPACFRKQPERLREWIPQWICAAHPYTVRFGIEMRMLFYLEERFQPSYLEEVAAVRSEHYYVRMMVAWFFATALATQWNHTLPYLEEKRLPVWIHNKAVQKALESYRITPEQKAYLRALKQKQPMVEE